MKKALLLVSLLGSMVALAEPDSYLYWMIDINESYNYAKIRADDNYLTIYDVGLGEIGSQISRERVLAEADFGDGLYAGMVDSGNLPTSFVVELFNDQGFAGQTEIPSSTVASYLYRGATGIPPTQFISASGFAIPEPSSGLLMLVGCAVLGLRRRKQKNA